MEKTGQVEITIKGRNGLLELKPDNYDIKEIIQVLQHVEGLLFPDSKKQRPAISYEIAEGSVKHIFKLTLQAVIGFNALLGLIKSRGYIIDFLEPPTAKALEYFQLEAQRKDYEYEIKTSISDDSKIIINKETKFIKSEEVWANAEFYFYGVIIDAGGKEKANIHLETKEYGVLKIAATKQFLENYENNPLYKSYGIRATGKQNIKTGELDKNSLQILEITGYQPFFKEDYLQSLIKKAKKSWSPTTDADECVQSIRGMERNGVLLDTSFF